MTEIYGHFDKPQVPYNTDDMFLCWDVPYESGTVDAIGYKGGKEICRHTVKTAGEPKKLFASIDNSKLTACGRDIAHIEIQIKDAGNLLCPDAHNRIHVSIEGPAELIGIDNGSPSCLDSFKGNSMEAAAGYLLAIIRSKREAGKIKIKINADNLEGFELQLQSE